MGGLGPGIGGSEWFIIGLVALLVVGPERLPGLLRQLGKMVAKARNMANEFRSSFDEMARQSELDELRREVEALRTGQPVRLGAEADVAFKNIKDEAGKPLLEAPVMTPAPSEWPDGDPVMRPLTPAEPISASPKAPKPKPRPKAASTKSGKDAPARAKPRTTVVKALAEVPSKPSGAAKPVTSKTPRKSKTAS